MSETLQGAQADRPIWGVCLPFGAMALFFAWLTGQTCAEQTTLRGAGIYAAVSLVCVGGVLWGAARTKGGSRLFGALLFAAALLLKGAFALALDTPPESDFGILYAAAAKLAAGVNVLPQSEYFQNWPYQSAFVAWMAFFIRFFGADVTFFKLTNCVFSALTTLLIYRIARRFASEGGARAAGAAFLLYPGTFLLVPVLTNQHLSELLLLLSLYVYTAPAARLRRNGGQGAAAGALLALGNAIRPVGIVAVLAVAAQLALGFLLWVRRDRSRLGHLALRAAAAVTVYFCVGAALSGLVRIAGLNPSGLADNVPEWKFILGLNEQSDGGFNYADNEALFAAGADTRRAAEALLRERLEIFKSPGRFFALVYRKARVMWGGFEPAYWAFNDGARAALSTHVSPEKLDLLLMWGKKLTAFFYLWANLLIAAGAVFAARRGRAQGAAALLMLAALAYFGAHFFIEVQTRYRSLMTVLTFPLIAPGADALGLTYLRQAGKGPAV